ncbi:DUF1768 domain-containing protein [Aphelenchoides fujianensis]|nr:DUF1768 domain-containing protein [Aphelenchoides fujianensis]
MQKLADWQARAPAAIHHDDRGQRADRAADRDFASPPPVAPATPPTTPTAQKQAAAKEATAEEDAEGGREAAKPAEQPAEKPVEKPVEKPSPKPAEKAAEQKKKEDRVVEENNNKAAAAFKDGVPVVEYTIDPNKVVCFSGKHFLSSFYVAPFEINGIRYLSVEHYYQATKLYATCGYEDAAKIGRVREPFAAKKLAREILAANRVPPKAVDGWKQSDGLITLIYAVALKFIQNRDIREQLFATKDKLLVQTHAGDNFYAAGLNDQDFLQWTKDNAGKSLKIPYNLNDIQGVLNMKIRHELMHTSNADLQDREAINRLLFKLAT